MKFSATTIFLVLMAVAACMMMAALISTSEHQASLEAKLDVMMRLQDQQRVARRASPDGAQVGGGGGGGASNHEIQPRPAAAMPQNSPDHGNNQPPMPAPLPPSPPKRVRGGARTLQDKYPVASSIGCRPDGGGYIPTGLEGTPLPPVEQPHHRIPKYLPYPSMQPLTELLEIWPPDEPDIPTHIPGIHAGSLARFDYRNQTQRDEAKRLQLHEIPFMLTNVPEVEGVQKLWTDAYLKRAFGNKPQHLLRSKSNHFMYWSKKLSRKSNNRDYVPPSEPEVVSFAQFLNERDAAMHKPVESEHMYLQINADRKHAFINRDLPFFQPKESFWMADHTKNKGINCRFGAKGIIAETHYDAGRNYVAMFKGSKRYVLSPPRDCKNLYLWPKEHPEGRHSKVDWSKLDLNAYPLMAKAVGTQVVVRAGEVLYIPSFWFHYIVSQDGSIQCNTRSGTSLRGKEFIHQCGFPMGGY